MYGLVKIGAPSKAMSTKRRSREMASNRIAHEGASANDLKKQATNQNAAASPKALKRIGQEIRSWALNHRSDKSLADWAQMYNPCICGWINYYSH
jgi:hypothetical protein